MTRESLLEHLEATTSETQSPDPRKIAQLRVGVLADSMQKLHPKKLMAAHALVELHLLRSGREAAYYRAVHIDEDGYFLSGMVSLEMLDAEQHSAVIASNQTGLIATVSSLVVPNHTFDLYRDVSDACPLVIYTAEATS